MGLVENRRRRSQSPACHIWDLGTCPAQVTRSRWYPWQVDGWRTEHPVNQRPWKRVTQRAPLTLSRSQIKVPYERAAWITDHVLKITRNDGKKRSDYLSTEDFAHERQGLLSFLSFSRPFFLPRLSSSLQLSPFTGGSFSRKVDSRHSKVAVSRWIICKLESLSVRVSEVSMAELSCSNTNHASPGRLEKLKLHGFDGWIEDVVVL